MVARLTPPSVGRRHLDRSRIRDDGLATQSLAMRILISGDRPSDAIAQTRGFEMRLNTLLAAAAIAAMTAGAAAAQSMAAPSGSDTTSAPMNSSTMDNSAAPAMAAPSADQNGTPAAATMSGPVESSPTPAAQAYTLKAGDPNVISNPPVPDTPANRAAFGKPMSNAGRHTAASGD
jgi:hypothetical protein